MTQDWKEALAALRGDADAGVTDNPANDTDAAPAVPTDGGKPATIIEGFDTGDDSEALATARTLKQRLGCGGSARGGEILLQGDRRQQAAALLRDMGYKLKGGC